MNINPNGHKRFLLPIKELVEVEGMGILERAKNVTKRYGLSTGLDTLDNYFRGGGLLPGLLYVVGARPGMGKTQFLLNIAKAVAEEGNPVAIFSLELTRERVLERLAYMEAGIDLMYHWQTKTDLSKEQLETLTTSLKRLQSLPIYIRDTTRLSPGAIRYTLEQEADAGVKLFVVDYLHIMAPDGKKFGREREIGGMIEDLRDHTKNLKLPCLLACQLNRAVEESKPYIPSLKDFRDSGTIEQVAYVVMLLYRRDYYYNLGLLSDDDKEPDEEVMSINNELDILVQKNQDAVTGVAKVNFDAATGRIADIGE